MLTPINISAWKVTSFLSPLKEMASNRKQSKACMAIFACKTKVDLQRPKMILNFMFVPLNGVRRTALCKVGNLKVTGFPEGM